MRKTTKQRIERLTAKRQPATIPTKIVLVGVERNEDGELVEVCRNPPLLVGKQPKD